MADRLPPVAILTPVHRPDPTYLAQLHESLDAQSGVTWEWAIQIDGGRSLMRRVPGDIRADGRVTLDNNGRWFGQAVTRNLALARVKHPLLQTVDADDLLLPGALAVAARALTADAELALAFGRTLRLRPDGARVPGKNPYPPGRLEPGRLARDWHRRGGSCPIVVGSVMWRTACVDAQGGWPALVAGMDVLLLCVWQVPLQRAVSTPIRTSTAATARRCIAARSASRCGRTIARSCAACWRLAARRHPRRAEVSRRLLRRPVEHLPWGGAITSGRAASAGEAGLEERLACLPPLRHRSLSCAASRTGCMDDRNVLRPSRAVKLLRSRAENGM